VGCLARESAEYAQELLDQRAQWTITLVVGVLSLLAGAVALLPPAPFTLDAPFAAAGLLALYLGASELLAIPSPHWRTA
jgi:uncharacterized membrane protein HdeD (DUF308 family)